MRSVVSTPPPPYTPNTHHNHSQHTHGMQRTSIITLTWIVHVGVNVPQIMGGEGGGDRTWGNSPQQRRVKMAGSLSE